VRTIFIALLSLLLLAARPVLAQDNKPARVRIENQNGNFRLLQDGEPYFIKGAVGSDYLDKLKAYGGNSIRTGSKPETLAKAHALGLTALVNLPVRAERDGMNYDDPEAVRQQHEKVLEIVRNTKDHPVVLMWSLGNELDFIQANVKEHYNVKVWDAVNALAKEIHRLDPNHPVMTVVGSIDQEKINDLVTRCPELDLLGVNEYGDLLRIPEWLRQYGWKKPYAVTEWGPTGFWQVPKTPWKAPVEETSSVKAAKYRERYEKTIAADKARCLGSYVFLWRQHQERTHTWFGMFDAEGRETEAVEVMHHAWTGKWPANRVPQLDSVKIGRQTAYDGVYLAPAQAATAQVWVRDPDGDALQYHWEVLREGTAFPYGGNGERKPPAVPGLIENPDRRQLSFQTPTEEGPYRLFVYAYDNEGHFATANVPFFVRK
jgi:hypothetical protein